MLVVGITQTVNTVIDTSTDGTDEPCRTQPQRRLRHYLHFEWKFTKASVEAFTAFMEASTEDMEATEASMKVFMEEIKAVERPWKIRKI